MYINENAPNELAPVGISHELMHEAGIFTDSIEHEGELTRHDIQIMSKLGIEPSNIAERLEGKVDRNSPLFTQTQMAVSINEALDELVNYADGRKAMGEIVDNIKAHKPR